jgi:hypothetical protein
VPVGDSKIPMPPRRRTSYSDRMNDSWMSYGTCGNAGKTRASASTSAAASPPPHGAIASERPRRARAEDCENFAGEQNRNDVFNDWLEQNAFR